jgi:hypothetical protein
VQLAVLGTAIDFLLDSTKGGPVVSFTLALTSAAALALAFAPPSWAHVGLTRSSRPSRRTRVPETV